MGAHRCVSHAFSVLFCEELGFEAAVSFLRKLCFSESTDWIRTLVDKILSHVADGLPFSRRALSFLYEESLIDSSYSDLPSNPHVTMSLQLTPGVLEEEFTADIASQQLVSCIRLSATVAWPLSLIITDARIEEFNAVFRMLLRIGQTRWWLYRVWPRFNDTKRYTDPSPKLRDRLRLVRLWYQVRLVLAFCYRFDKECTGCPEPHDNASKLYAP